MSVTTAPKRAKKGSKTMATANTNESQKTPKSIKIYDADGNAYTLEFNRKVVLSMQNNGFVLDLDRLYKTTRELVSGAFRMHHNWMRWEQIEPIWVYQGSKRGELLGYLANMFSKPALDLMGDGSEEEETVEPEHPFELNF